MVVGGQNGCGDGAWDCDELGCGLFQFPPGRGGGSRRYGTGVCCWRLRRRGRECKAWGGWAADCVLLP